MFFCCNAKDKKSEYALEAFETSGNLSEISRDKSIALKGGAFSGVLRSRVVGRMGKNQEKGQQAKL
jgi:hypothetical protein